MYMYMYTYVCLFVCCYVMPFQLYLGGDMMYEMSRRKPEPTHLPTQAIFNLEHNIGMIWENLAFDDAVSYT